VESGKAKTNDMKKVIAVTILTILGYGTPHSSACKYESSSKILTSKDIDNKTHSSKQTDDDDMVFHPLIFVCVPFK
jgi:hypothetical protein